METMNKLTTATKREYVWLKITMKLSMNVNWECCRLLFKRKEEEKKRTVRFENSIVSPRQKLCASSYSSTTIIKFKLIGFPRTNFATSIHRKLFQNFRPGRVRDEENTRVFELRFEDYDSTKKWKYTLGARVKVLWYKIRFFFFFSFVHKINLILNRWLITISFYSISLNKNWTSKAKDQFKMISSLTNI